MAPEGWHGWDEYAPFYDWENRRTLGRRDLPFWLRLAEEAASPVLELGCGTGRLSLRVARRAPRFVGIDRSPAMLERIRERLRRARLGSRALLVRGDVRALPFQPSARFGLVMAPYGLAQSLLRDRDLDAALRSAATVMRAGARLGVDLVPDLPRWREYRRRVSLQGRRDDNGPEVTLIESVRQDRARELTMFDQEFVERRGRRRDVRRFSLTFRTRTVPTMVRHLERAGFRIEALYGDYRGGDWAADADTWLIVARKAR
jgi:SAM-dependent methyltransferase